MRVKKVELKDYKRFKHLCIELPEEAKLIVLTGPNGCGKSSIFEAFNTRSRSSISRQDGLIYEQDSEYHLNTRKDVSTHQHYPLNENIIIELYDALDKSVPTNISTPEFIIRSAYRCSADFQVSQFGGNDHAFDAGAPQRLIDIDARVEDNYKKILSASINDLFSPENNDVSAKTIKDKIIGTIRDAVSKIFPDLILSDLGANPMSQGTFRFTKGVTADFHYKNLSGGEKAVFDLLLDFIIKSKSAPNTIFCIDEPELHMHNKIQAKFLEVLFAQIPNNGQLWITTHSVGIIRKAVDLWKENKQQVIFIDLHDKDLDNSLTVTPVTPSQNFWKIVFDTNLGDLANLMLPKQIILCEGDPKNDSKKTKENKEFDAEIYNKIFSNSYPDTKFISLGSQSEVKNKGLLAAWLLKSLASEVKIIRFIDRDDHNDEEIAK